MIQDQISRIYFNHFSMLSIDIFYNESLIWFLCVLIFKYFTNYSNILFFKKNTFVFLKNTLINQLKIIKYTNQYNSI